MKNLGTFIANRNVAQITKDFLNFVDSNKNWRHLKHAKYIFARRSGLNFLKACANSDLQTVNAQDTPMPPPRKWMMPVALSMVMLSALGWIEGTT